MLLERFHKNEQQMERSARIGEGCKNFRTYCNLVNPDFFKPERAYQDELCNTLQALYENRLGDGLKPKSILIINMPPGFGKTYTTLLFATWCYGQNIKNQTMAVSYSQDLSDLFSKTTRGLINDEEIPGEPGSFVVNSFFPDVKIKYGDAAMKRWSLEGYHNSFLATSIDGTITGFRGNIGVIDDPIKNDKEAVNEHTKALHWGFYKNTFRSRMLDGGKQIIVQTRWATDDLAGMLLREFPDECYELKMQAIVDGKSLCEDLYSLEDLLDKKRTLDEHIWLANFMQEPIDIKGALYGPFKTYDVVDADRFERIISYTDTADLGTDYLCCIIAGVVGRYAYVLDIYYTDVAMEDTEPETARRLHHHGARESVIESNNGGRGFARNVGQRLKALRNTKCNITWFYQSKNKRTRILVNASNVMEQVIMPEGWTKKFPKFFEHLQKYQRKGKNAFDDGPDTLTGIVKMVNGEVKGKNKAKVLKRSWLGI